MYFIYNYVTIALAILILIGDDLMIEKLRKFNSENRIWMYLLRYISFSIGLSITAVLIDTGTIDLIDRIPLLFLTSIDLAKTILSTLASALLTITTFTFSTIMVVLTMYSSEFSPRVVNNFLTDKISMKVLGLFVGGFFYSIITLFFMKNSFSEHLVLSATIGVLYSIFSLIYFVIFIYKVSSSIQATKLIEKIYNESYTIIEDKIKNKDGQKSLNEYDSSSYKLNYKIKSNKTGYFQLMNLDSILSELKDIDSLLIINSNIGDFININQHIATIYFNDVNLENSIKDKILRKFTFDGERLSFNDYRFSLQKIVDIALRAISPGINDPNTAIHCINILGVLFGQLCKINDNYTLIEEDTFKGKIIYEDFNFKDDLYFTFYQIVHYGKEDISVVIALLNTMNQIKNVTNVDKNIKILNDFSDYIFHISKNNFNHPIDLDLLTVSRYKTI